MKHWQLGMASLIAATLGIAMFTTLPAPATAPVSAQGTGSIAGQVVWCAPIPVRGGVVGGAVGGPTAAIAEGEGASGTIIVTTPDGNTTVVAQEPPGQAGVAVQQPPVQPDGTTRPGPVPLPIQRPIPPRPIPAGAVLVAVQNTSLSARTDEAGNFRIDGVPIGQFFTVAAGPVSSAPGVNGMRPNVTVASAGQTVSLGQLSLGGPCFVGPVPLPATTDAQPGEPPAAP